MTTEGPRRRVPAPLARRYERWVIHDRRSSVDTNAGRSKPGLVRHNERRAIHDRQQEVAAPAAAGPAGRPNHAPKPQD